MGPYEVSGVYDVSSSGGLLTRSLVVVSTNGLRRDIQEGGHSLFSGSYRLIEVL